MSVCVCFYVDTLLVLLLQAEQQKVGKLISLLSQQKSIINSANTAQSRGDKQINKECFYAFLSYMM